MQMKNLIFKNSKEHKYIKDESDYTIKQEQQEKHT